MPASKMKRPAASPKAPARRSIHRSAKAPALMVKNAGKANVWTKQYFGREQDQFFRSHPRSKILLAVFVGVVALFLYLIWMNKTELFPQAFIW